MFLSATTQSLEIDLNGAVAANQLPVTFSYVDVNQTTFAMSAMTTDSTQTNNTTAATIVSGTAGQTRQIKYLCIKNSDTSPVLLWVQLNDNGTLREQTKCTLAVNDSLIYTDTDGWDTIDSTGAKKYSQGGWTIAAGKSGTLNNSITFAGTDGTTVTFPSTSATVARTDAGQTFTGTNTFGALTLTGNVGVTGTPSFTLTGCSFTAGALVGTSLSTGSGAISGGAITASGNIIIDKASPLLTIKATTGTASEVQWANSSGTVHWSAYEIVGGAGSQGAWVLTSTAGGAAISISNAATPAVTIPGTTVNMTTSGTTLTVGVGADNGTVSAGVFTDRTKAFDGDAVAAIKAIKAKNGHIDHATLPAFVRENVRKQTTDAEGNVVETIEVERNIGAMVSLLTSMAQQQEARITALEQQP